MYQNPNGPYGGPDEPYMNETYGQDGGVPYAGGSAYRAPEPGDADFDAPKRRTIFKPRLSKPNFVFSVLVNAVRFLMIVVVLCGLAAAGAVLGIAKGYMETAPTLDLALLDDQDRTSFLYDASGNVITDYKGTENRVMVNISLMPDQLRNAFVAVEDARFYTHNGIDIKRIIGSFVQNFVSGSQQGGSTITQQLIKNTVLSNELSYKRKIQEAYLAMQLETKYTKAQILEYYLNTIYLGENYYGVQVAAQGYFGKELGDLSLRECAMLAGLTNNPYYYNPRRNFYVRTSETTDYAAITNTRTDYALRMMYENQFITYEEYVAALEPSTATVLRQSPDAGSTYNYIYYVEYAVNDVVQTLLKLNNLENTSYNRNLMENELPKFHGEYDDDMLYEKAGEILHHTKLIDVRDALKEGIAEGGQVCYRTDHHLTSLGNYLLYRAYQIDQGRAYLSRDAYQVTATDGFYGTTWSGSGYWFTKPDTVEVWDSGIQTKVTLRDGSAAPIYSDSLYFPKHLEEIDKYPVFLDGIGLC